MLAAEETGGERGVVSPGPGRALALARIPTLPVASTFAPAVTLQSLHLAQLTPGLAGLGTVVGGVKFLAVAGGVTARFLARQPSAMTIAPGD